VFVDHGVAESIDGFTIGYIAGELGSAACWDYGCSVIGEAFG
jgi:hypothetical protein